MEILERVRRFESQMIDERRYLHEHPELSGEEVKTCGYLSSVLESLGMEIHDVPNGGIIGVLDSGSEGMCVLLRADVDALPIRENPKNACRERSCISRKEGVMHACGHDAHTAMLLCAARVLASMKGEWNGRVLFVFERGEERGGKGFLENLLPYIDAHFDVDACYATHVRWDIPSGKIAVMDGAVMAGGFGFDVKICGRGGHGSRPDLAASPVDCFAAIHQQLLALRLRAAAPDQVLTYSLGEVHAGHQANIIPDTLRFSGTVRTFDTAGAGERFALEMKKVIDCTCALHGCAYELTHFSNPIYETCNHPLAAQRAREAIVQQVGADVLTSCTPWMASESMSAYLRLWPGVLSFTGIRCEEKGCGANHHTPEFDVDEDALRYGAAAACAYALDMLRSRPDFAFTRRIVSMEDLVSRSI